MMLTSADQQQQSVSLVQMMSFVRSRLIYGQEGKLIPEAMEDESDLMRPEQPGQERDGGDGVCPTDGHRLTRSEEAQLSEELLISNLYKSGMIGPTSNFRSQWDIAQAFLLIYIAITLPFRLGFDQPTKPWEFWFIFDLLVDLYFWVDIVLNFRTAVYTFEGELEYRPRAVAQLYARGWFPIDLVSCLPFAYLEYMMDTSDMNMEQNKMVRMLRMMRLFKLMRLARFKRLLDRWEEQLYSTGGLKMFKLLAVIFMSAHWAACGWYACGTDIDLDITDALGVTLQGWAHHKFDYPADGTSLLGRYIISYCESNQACTAYAQRCWPAHSVSCVPCADWALMNLCTVDSAVGGDIFPSTILERV
jgi:hypothetical protein